MFKSYESMYRGFKSLRARQLVQGVSRFGWPCFFHHTATIGRNGMDRSILSRRASLNLIGALILLVGLGSAALIYHQAQNAASGALGYESGNDAIYPVMPEDSKQYLRDMELYGGKANVLADKFRRWLIGLWQGKSLALIIAVTASIISLGVFYTANIMPGSSASKTRQSENFHNNSG